MVYDQPLEENFQYALDNGIHHLEIDLKKKYTQINTFTSRRIAVILEKISETGISLSLHPPFNLDLCTRSFITRRSLTSYLEKCIVLASRLKAEHLTLHLGSFHRSALWSDPREQALDRLCFFLKKLLNACDRTGICLALENVVPLRPEAGFAFLGDNIKDFLYIYSKLDSPHLKFCLDCGHANTNEGPLEYVDKLGEKITCVHFHDNRGTHDEHLEVGQGTIPWKELMPALQDIGFHGPFISECFKTKPHEAIKRLKSFMQYR